MAKCAHVHTEFKSHGKNGEASLECLSCHAALKEASQWYYVKGVKFSRVNGDWRDVGGYVRLVSKPAMLGFAEARMDDKILVRFYGEIIENNDDVEFITGSQRTALYKINPTALQMVHGVTAIAHRRPNAKPGDHS